MLHAELTRPPGERESTDHWARAPDTHHYPQKPTKQEPLRPAISALALLLIAHCDSVSASEDRSILLRAAFLQAEVFEGFLLRPVNVHSHGFSAKSCEANYERVEPASDRKSTRLN